MSNINELKAKLKAAAEKATALNLDSAELKRGHSGDLECPCCEGAGYVEEENDFCNIDGVALGVQFYGIGPYHGLAEEYLRLAKPAAVLELIAALESQAEEFKRSVRRESSARARSDELQADCREKDARIAELTDALKQAVSGYKSCLRTGHERIIELGGECDEPEVMIAGNPDIRQAEKVLASGSNLEAGRE